MGTEKNNNNVNNLITPYVVFSVVGFELQMHYNTFYPTSVIRVVLIIYNILALAVVILKMSIVENVSKTAEGILERSRNIYRKYIKDK